MLRVWERKVLRKVFGAVRNNDGWRIRTNTELQAMYQKPSVMKDIKAGRLRWLGHVERMEAERTPKKLLAMKPEGIRLLGRPRRHWFDGISKDLKTLGVNNWRRVASLRDVWRTEVVVAAKVLPEL